MTPTFYDAREKERPPISFSTFFKASRLSGMSHADGPSAIRSRAFIGRLKASTCQECPQFRPLLSLTSHMREMALCEAGGLSPRMPPRRSTTYQYRLAPQHVTALDTPAARLHSVGASICLMPAAARALLFRSDDVGVASTTTIPHDTHESRQLVASRLLHSASGAADAEPRHHSQVIIPPLDA